ncbi:SET domain-containing protein [Aureococcus anophagefferens]|nr:SET domain-containing protein [Aureococcus anophagefferens]
MPARGSGRRTSARTTRTPRTTAARARTRRAAAAVPHEAGEAPRARGKWTEAEERYAALIVARFSDGTFPGLRGGESLRNLLADLLQCTGMRVTKKYSRTRLLRKTAFVRAGELGADGVEALESERAAFLADEPQYCPHQNPPKSCFWPLGELTAEEHAELDAARDQFIAAEPHYRRA